MKNHHKATAIILARSGSKGIIDKNLQKIAKKSLLECSINTAFQSQAIENIFVSSDSEKYLKIAEMCGANPIVRPNHLSSDQSSSEEGLLHAIKFIEENNYKLNDTIIFIQCTSPLTDSKDIDNAFLKFNEKKYDSLFSAVDHHGFIWKRDDIKGINHNENHLRERRQDKDREILETGAFYILNTSQFKTTKNRFFGEIGFFIQDKINSFEIDDSFDLELNRFIYKKYLRHHKKINIQKVKLIVSDFDGVLTDNNVETNKDGIESVITSKSDSLAISTFRKENPHIPIIVLTSEQNISVQKRCEKLQLPCHQVTSDKKEYLSQYLSRNNISPENVVYVGNDKNDLTCLNYVGFPIAVADSDPKLFSDSILILNSKGGSGALKELMNLIK
tara:strand:+ start:33 stop:1199 length:1167 start_codon:yes stop_codon:yes gene_type:complete